MNFSDKGIGILKQLEGYVKHSDKHVIYNDGTGKPLNPNSILPHGATIGYGHLIKPGEIFKNGITEIDATNLLRADIATAERAVRDNITVTLSQHQYDALVIFAYNIGEKNFTNSTVVKYINNKNFHSAIYPNIESAWKSWNRTQGAVSKGLVNRRQYEWNLFSKGEY